MKMSVEAYFEKLRGDQEKNREESWESFFAGLTDSVKRRDWRTILILVNAEGQVLCLFPEDDLTLRDEYDIAAVELYGYIQRFVPQGVTAYFGHLGIKDEQLFVHTATKNGATRVDRAEPNALFQNFVSGNMDLVLTAGDEHRG
jgi:hypothetical protein